MRRFNMEINGITIDEKKAQTMLKKIIIIEKNNIADKNSLSDAKMVEKIKKMIEEEAKCF